ncbi:acyl-CoA dehydrogenase family protein [Streptomyces sp. NPDC057638]|uniref:acyl-CoA dehydrogenase family protein n=1 Tax=Streptomyces sp. NPDC057638 TaxID=3346190 RepID=UPI0036CEF0E8
MDLRHSPDVLAFRAEARAWLTAHTPARPLPSLETREGFAAHRAWEAELAADRWSVVSWPKEYGGRGADLEHWLVFEEEYHAAGAPGRVSQNGISLLAPTLLAHGTTEQRARILPPMASGAQVWAQAWSEPEAGSDLASLRARADRTTGGWLLSGRKTWSSRAAFADRAFGLFRCDPEAGRPHQGLISVMFGLTAPGVTVHPIGRLDGKPAFAELCLDEVFVPDRDVIGAPGDGWRIAMDATADERGLTLRSPGRYLAAAARLTALWRASGRTGDTALRDRVADAVIGARAYQLFVWAAASRALADPGRRAPSAPSPLSSLTKVHWSELDLALHETALDLLAEDGEFADTPWAEGHLFALAGPIYAGTNEIQRDIIAERLLGLPKGRR